MSYQKAEIQMHLLLFVAVITDWRFVGYFKHKLDKYCSKVVMMMMTMMIMMSVASLKRGPVSVEKVLLSLTVPVHTTFSRIAEQGVGKSRERPELCLVALSTDVDDHSLTSGRGAVVVVRQQLTTLIFQSRLLRRYTQRILVPARNKFVTSNIMIM